MAYYEVRNRLNDTYNGLSFYRGQVLETEDSPWVARWGSTLKEIRVVADGVDIVKVSGTVEQKKVDNETKAEEPKEKASEEVAKPSRRAVRRAQVAKVVTDDDPDIK